MRYQSDGEDGFVISDPNNPTPTKPVPDATPAPPLRSPRRCCHPLPGRHLTVLADGRDHRAENALASRRTVRTNAGPTSLALAGSDAIVDFGDGRENQLRRRRSHGWLLRGAGGGYELPAGPTMAPAAKPEPTPRRRRLRRRRTRSPLEGVEGTSAGADIVHGQIRKAAGEAPHRPRYRLTSTTTPPRRMRWSAQIASQTDSPSSTCAKPRMACSPSTSEVPSRSSGERCTGSCVGCDARMGVSREPDPPWMRCGISWRTTE